MDASTTLVAAIFSTREAAHAATTQLHDAGLTQTWTGVTHTHDVELAHDALADAQGGDRGYVPDAVVGSTIVGAVTTDAAVHDLTDVKPELDRELVVEDEDDSLLDRIGRFFSGTGDLSLHDALIQHGVGAEDAQRIEDELVADDVILLVNDVKDDTAVRTIVEGAGGRMLVDVRASEAARGSYLDAATIREDVFMERQARLRSPR